ncbi:MAG: hypothetical protein ACI4OX_04445 [Akkermansia sp.]
MNAKLLNILTRWVFAHAVIVSLFLYLVAVSVFDLYLVLADNMFFPSVLHRWSDAPENSNMVLVSYFLSCPLSYISSVFPDLELCTLYLHLCNLMALACFSYSVIRTKVRPGIRHYIGWMLIAIYVCVYALNCEYAIVSFSAMASGLVMICRNSCSKHRLWLLSFGTLVFTMGCLLRYDSCIGILPFIAILVWIAYRRKNFVSMIAYAMCVLCVVVCYLAQGTLSSADYGKTHVENLVALNGNRTKFCDYEDDSGLDKSNKYREVGCSENDLSLYYGGVCLEDKCLDENYWSRLGEIRDQGRPTFSLTRACRMFMERNYVRNLLIPPFVILILLLLCRNALRIQYGDYFIFVSIICYILLLMRGRINTVSSLAVMQPCLALWVAHMPRVLSSRLSRWILFILMACGSFFALKGLPRYRATFPAFGCRWADPELTSRVEDECRRHGDRIYFTEVHFWRYIALPYSSILSADLKRCPNLYPYHGWQFIIPAYQASLRKRGVESPSKLLLGDNVRFILRVNNAAELEKMEGGILPLLQKSFICVQENQNIRLKLVAEKKLCDNLYVVRVEKNPS